jgi:tRNA pseudouridine55 synthase
VPTLDPGDIDACLQRHAGPQLQAPPPYSAAKYKGKPLYTYARQGILIEKEAKPIEIFSLVLKAYDPETYRLDLEVQCSRGTYIRVLAADIGRALGCGAHLVGLRRTASGPFSVDDCLTGTELFAENGLQLLLSGRRSIEEAVRFVSRPSL